ncbi:MAG: thioredoxin family protein [Calditrichia bacterium]
MVELKEHLKQSRLLVAYFSYPGCSVCRVLLPKVKQITGSCRNCSFVYINTQEDPETGGQYLVFTAPTIIIFVDGKESRRFSRHFSLQDLKDFLKRIEEIL